MVVYLVVHLVAHLVAYLVADWAEMSGMLVPRTVDSLASLLGNMGSKLLSEKDRKVNMLPLRKRFH